MLFPPGNLDPLEPETPETIKNGHYIFWWLLLFLFVGLFALQCFAYVLFSAIYTVIMAFIVWYMVKDNCAAMSQYCLLWFGLMCTIQCVFDTLTLCTMLGGRRTESTTRTSMSKTHTTYVTTVETHPFFDPTQGLRYNLESWARIISPCVMLLAALLARHSYNAYPLGLFSALDEDRPFGQGGGGAYGGGASYGGYGASNDYGGGRPLGGGGRNANGGHPLTSAGRGGGRGDDRAFSAFQGTGQRLGGAGATNDPGPAGRGGGPPGQKA